MAGTKDLKLGLVGVDVAMSWGLSFAGAIVTWMGVYQRECGGSLLTSRYRSCRILKVYSCRTVIRVGIATQTSDGSCASTLERHGLCFRRPNNLTVTVICEIANLSGTRGGDPRLDWRIWFSATLNAFEEVRHVRDGSIAEAVL